MPNYRPIFPNIFTTGNLICGFLSIISAAEGDPTQAAWFIILAGFLDALDDSFSSASNSGTPADTSGRQSLAEQHEGNLATQTRVSIRPPRRTGLRRSAEAESNEF